MNILKVQICLHGFGLACQGVCWDFFFFFFIAVVMEALYETRESSR